MPTKLTRKRSRKPRYSTEVLGILLEHNRQLHQVGGAIIEGAGIRYNYRVSQNSNTIVFHGGRKAGKRECFLLLIEPTKEAILQSLKQGSDCAMDPNGSGRSMVLAALNLAKQNGAVSFGLADDSKVWFDNDTRYFVLSNMYFLTSGETWYKSILPELTPTDPVKAAKINEWRIRALTNTWADVSQRLPQNIVIPVDISDIDIGRQGSAMEVLRRIKDAKTTFFADYDDELLIASNIGSLRGISWSMRI